MTRSNGVTSAQITKALKAFGAQGQPIRGARLYTDGSIDLLCEVPENAADPVATSWVDLAGDDGAKDHSQGR